MHSRPTVLCVAALSLALFPATAFAQSVNVTRSILQDQPYTLIYPDTMVASGGADEPLTINNPNAPLQCDLTVEPVKDTSWTAENALASLNDAEVTASWLPTFPGFTLGEKSITQYQSGPALLYVGTSTDSPLGVALTIVHTETVSNARGYVLDCLFSTDVAANARPIVNFIIANFSTRADAECCRGVEVVPDEPTPAQ